MGHEVENGREMGERLDCLREGYSCLGVSVHLMCVLCMRCLRWGAMGMQKGVSRGGRE